MAKEIELKLLLLEPDICTYLYDHPTLNHYCKDGPKTFDVRNTYFDTDQYDLAKHKMAIRIRESQGQWLQTIKMDESVEEGLHQRHEETIELSKPFLDLSLIKNPAMRDTVGALAEEHVLSPIFTTHFSRTQWLLDLSEDDQVEVVLDLGEVQAGDEVRAINEIELELTHGAAVYALYEIAADLATNIPLAIEPHSKAWWGYKLHQTQQAGHQWSEQIDYPQQSAEFFLQQAEQARQSLDAS